MSTSSSSALSNVSTLEFKLAPAPPPGPKANRLRRASPMRPDHVQVFETVDLDEPMGPVYTGRLSYPTDTLDRPLPEIEPLPAARVPASEAFCRLFMCRVLINALLVALGLLVTCVALAFGLSIAFTVLGRLVIRDFLNSISFIPRQLRAIIRWHRRRPLWRCIRSLAKPISIIVVPATISTTITSSIWGCVMRRWRSIRRIWSTIDVFR